MGGIQGEGESLDEEGQEVFEGAGAEVGRGSLRASAGKNTAGTGARATVEWGGRSQSAGLVGVGTQMHGPGPSWGEEGEQEGEEEEEEEERCHPIPTPLSLLRDRTPPRLSCSASPHT